MTNNYTHILLNIIIDVLRISKDLSYAIIDLLMYYNVMKSYD